MTAEARHIDDEIELIDDSLEAEFDRSGFNYPSTSGVQKTNVNTSAHLNTSDLNVSALCCDEELNGYDKLAGKQWIYPVNYPVRDYQFNIIKAAIAKNTLVGLPTGLGKTFIAAVLMHNFYRWYPLGKIVFTAPTRPLIAQQIQACHKITGMPPSDIIEMTGNMDTSLRKENWKTKRIFFVTPQTMYNDIKNGICPGERIRCLVIDEAHKAKKNYAYCQIVSTLTDMDHRMYRILALSATPGSRIPDVVQVVQNLHIAHLELRTEASMDVAPYCHARNIQPVVIPLGAELTKIRDAYIAIMDSYARRLKDRNILGGNLGNMSKGRILMIYKEYQNSGHRHPDHGYIMKDLVQMTSLFHGLEQLVNHGSRAFLKYFSEQTDKQWMQNDERLMELLNKLQEDLGPDPLTLGPSSPTPTNLNFGHPKFDKVKELIENHFKTSENKETRAIVFCEFHESVLLVQCMLRQCAPLVRPQRLVGQGAGRKGRGGVTMSQQEQLRAMARFRAGRCNVLVATCVAEEGLDVGSVDLILCFDVATRSPVRLLQRCGRTGRERSGKVYCLVTEGREYKIFLDSMKQSTSLISKIQGSTEVHDSLYKLNPRMIPYNFMPICEKRSFKVGIFPIKSSRKSLESNRGSKNKKIQNKKRTVQNPINEDNSTNDSHLESIATDSFPNILTKLQPLNTGSSLSPNKRVSPQKRPQKLKSKLLSGKTASKGTDIRLFLGASKPSHARAILFNELRDQNTKISMEMLELLTDLKIASEYPKTCYLCKNNCACQQLLKLRKKEQVNTRPMMQFDNFPAFPNLDLMKSFNAELILNCIKPTTESDIPIDNVKAPELKENELDLMDEDFYTSNFVNDDDGRIINEPLITLHDSHNFDIGDADDIFAESPQKNENTNISENKCDDNTLPQWYSNFDVGSFEDILGASQENLSKLNECCQKLREDMCKELQNSDTCENVTYNNQNSHILQEDIGKELQNSKIFTIDITQDDSPERNQDIIPPQFRSPSIISGNYTTNLKSPILTQSKKRHEGVSLASTFGPKSKRKLKLGLNRSRSNSMLSVTQMIDQINASDVSQSSNEDNQDETTLSPVFSTSTVRNNSLSSKRYTENTVNLIQADCNDTKSPTKKVESIRRSPILLTQADGKKKKHNTKIKESASERDTASNSHVNLLTPTSSNPNKRKLDIFASPYFNKKPKLQNQDMGYAESIQEKVSAAILNNCINTEHFPNDVENFNCRVPEPTLSPEILKLLDRKQETKENKPSPSLASKFSYVTKRSQELTKTVLSERILNCNQMPKKKKSKNEFIDSEALLSGDDFSGSGDELTDDSAGSLVDFETNADITTTEEDMFAYLKSVRSPYKPGAFKIPELPARPKNNIFSQYLEPDSYEMDSFCVDSHIGLTQSNTLTELELAERVLEEERRQKKRKKQKHSTQENGDSPVIQRKNRKKYNVISDSDDSEPDIP